MKKLLYLSICLLPLLISCKKNKEIQYVQMNDSLFKVVIVNPDDLNRKERSRISEISDSVEYIPLQTNDSILIGEIRKLIVWNNRYYIWDNLSETVYSFDLNGQFRSKIHKQGEGPDEYLRISDFTVDIQTGNIVIYSDVSRGFYEYMENGTMVKKTASPFILSSFAARDGFKYCYIGKLPNMDFFKQTFPNSYRYLALKDSDPQSLQLPWVYNEKFLQLPLSINNFSFYKDTILITEFLNPKVYMIDSIGNLKPRYRVKFSTNTCEPDFNNEEIDLEQIEDEEKQGNLTFLFNGFYETDKYLFFNYSRGLIGTAYVDKKDYSIRNLGYFLLDDFNQNSLSASINYVDEKYMYKIVESGMLLMKKKDNFSPYLKKICNTIQEFDNPVIIKIKLK